MESRVTNLEARMSRLEHVILGNGSAGLDERMRNTIDRLDALVDSVKGLTENVAQLVKERDRDEAAKEGSRRTLAQVRAIGLALIALLGVGGGVGLSRVLGALEALGGLP